MADQIVDERALRILDCLDPPGLDAGGVHTLVAQLGDQAVADRPRMQVGRAENLRLDPRFALDILADAEPAARHGGKFGRQNRAPIDRLVGLQQLLRAKGDRGDQPNARRAPGDTACQPLPRPPLGHLFDHMNDFRNRLAFGRIGAQPLDIGWQVAGAGIAQQDRQDAAGRIGPDLFSQLELGARIAARRQGILGTEKHHRVGIRDPVANDPVIAVGRLKSLLIEKHIMAMLAQTGLDIARQIAILACIGDENPRHGRDLCHYQPVMRSGGRLARPAGVEPATSRLEVSRSIQLSYGARASASL